MAKKKSKSEKPVDPLSPPLALSASVMDALEATDGVHDAAAAALAADEDLFGSDTEEDKDPTYVPSPRRTRTVAVARSSRASSTSTPVAGTSGTGKTVGRVKPLFTSPIKPLPGASGRSKNPIWNFFRAIDKEVPSKSGVGVEYQKFAECQVLKGGAICGAMIKQGQSTATGMNSHLHFQHPKGDASVKAAKTLKDAEKTGAKCNIATLFATAEGVEIPDTF